MKHALYRWLRWAEVDRAVSYGVLTSGWQVASAPMTAVMIIRYWTPEVQGFYYTFNSLLALQSFAELGLVVVIVNLASHGWTQLGLNADGQIVGDPDALSRLVSLGRFVCKWYALASLIFMTSAGICGHIFFSQSSNPEIAWMGPWWILIILAGMLLWALPYNALLAGCNQIVAIQKFRLIQTILGSLILWLLLVFGGGLWSAVAASGAAALCNLYLLAVSYRRFFEPFFKPPSGRRVDWKSEIWPMQWRLALSGMAGYFMFQAFNPVIFKYYGAAAAGRMGMTLSIVFALNGLVLKWLDPKVPHFGMLVARKDYAGLDLLWRRTTQASVVVACSGALTAWLIVFGLNTVDSRFAGRLLPPLPTGLLLLGTVFMSLSYCQTAYLRAHIQDPLVVMSIVTSLLMGLLVWGLGSHFGSMGAAVAYVIVLGAIGLPWETMIWFRCRAKWHQA